MGVPGKLHLVIWALSLSCLVEGLQYPLEYHYHYRGRLISHIPEINEGNASTSDIKADVVVYAYSAGHATFKLEHVEVADSHVTRADCESEHDLPVEYRVPHDDEPGHLIGLHPFSVDKDNLVFHEADPQWLTNFYKSIIQMFTTQPIRKAFLHMPNAHEIEEAAYRTREENVMGACDAVYTQYHLHGVALNEHRRYVEHHIEHDVQLDGAKSASTKTSRKTTKTSQAQVQIPPITPTVWQVIRSVDLKDCETRVEHQHTPSGVSCSLAGDQCDNLLSRNSHGVFFIRGDSAGVRLEKAIVRGAVLVSPFGFESEKLETNSIQTLSLASVKTLSSNVPSVTSPKTDAHLLYKMTIAHEQSLGAPYSWTVSGTWKEAHEHMFAIRITPEIELLHRNQALKLIKHVYEIATNPSVQKEKEHMPTLMKHATELLSDFDKKGLSSLMDDAVKTLSEGEIDLLVGVYATIGNNDAIEILINKFNGGKVTAFREAFMFGTLQKNLKSANALKTIKEYLKLSNLHETPFKTAHSLINFASTVKSFCVKTNHGSFGEESKLQCEADNIVHEVEEYLISHLKSADKFWEQMVYVRSLVNLGTKEAFEALKPYILGQEHVDTMVRITAMQSLARWNAAPGTCSKEVKLMLFKIFENPQESGRVRAKALSFIASWDLCSTMWSRLAFSTRRPLLQDLAAFTYSIIETMAHYKDPSRLNQAAYAGHALQLAKKFSPHERHSSFMSWFDYNFDTKMGSLNHKEKILDPLSPLPADISIYVRREIGGGFVHKKLDVMIENHGSDLESLILNLFRGRTEHHEQQTSGTKEWDTVIDVLTKGLDIHESVRGPLHGLLDVMPMNAMQFFVPLEKEFLQDMLKITYGALKEKEHHIFYYNAAELKFVTVNDIGMPVIVHTSMPKVWYFSGLVGVHPEGHSHYKVDCKNCGFHFGSDFDTHIETLALWSMKKLSAGVKRDVEITQPFDIEADIIHTNSKEHTTGVSIKLTPSKLVPKSGKVALFVAENTPYLGLNDIVCTGENYVLPDFDIVIFKKLRNDELSLPHGLHMSHQSELKYPINDIFAKNLKPLMTTRHWAFEVDLDFEKRRNMVINFDFKRTHLDMDKNKVKYVSKYGQDSYSEDEVCGAVKEDFTQQTGQTSDFADYTQQSSSTQDLEEFGFGEQKSGKLQHSDVEINRPSYGVPDASVSILTSYIPVLRKEKGWTEKIWGYSVRYSVTGDETTTEDVDASEIAIMMTICNKYVDQRKLKFLFVAAKSNNPCDTVCGDGEVKFPKFSDMDTLTTLKNKDLGRRVTYKAYVGEKCSSGPFLDIDDLRTISKQQVDQAIASTTDCEFKSNDPVDEFSVSALYDALDITMKNDPKILESSCTSTFIPLFKNMYKRFNSWLHANSNVDFCYIKRGDVKDIRVIGKRWEEHTFRGTVNATTLSGEKLYQEAQMIASQWAESTVSKVAHSFLTEYEPADYCVISETSLTTFDGMTTHMEVDDCPVLAVTNCESGSDDAFVVGVSKSTKGGLAISVASHSKHTVINMDSHGVQVNGHAMPASDYTMDITHGDEIMGHVYKRNGFYKVELIHLGSVILKEGAAYIKSDGHHNGFLCGLCGNHNHNKFDDMKQPNGCLLTDGEKFRKSWIPATDPHCVSSSEENPETCITA